jgi:hypothetical protein
MVLKSKLSIDRRGGVLPHTPHTLLQAFLRGLSALEFSFSYRFGVTKFYGRVEIKISIVYENYLKIYKHIHK